MANSLAMQPAMQQCYVRAFRFSSQSVGYFKGVGLEIVVLLRICLLPCCLNKGRRPLVALFWKMS